MNLIHSINCQCLKSAERANRIMVQPLNSSVVRSVLTNFVIFETVARLGNFSRAAEELNLTQSAISHAIRKIEDMLGRKLFYRTRPTLGLTREGEQLLLCAEQCITLTRAAIGSIASSPKARQDALLVAVSTSMARYWLLPRIPEIRTAIPDLRLWIQTVDRDIDLYAEGVDLNIVFGSQSHPEYDQKALWSEKVIAVCSPEFLSKHGPFQTLEELSQATLIHYEERVRPRINWDDWFAANGLSHVAIEREVRFADYALVLEAAMAGRGVALGWRPIIDDLIVTNRLTIARPEFASGHQRFSLLTPKGALSKEPSRAFYSWLAKNYLSGQDLAFAADQPHPGD
ncbi:LysR substrate-binding domain-containing protein [Aquamicrobium terrae]|uniref:DNA-binding transcriptional LysR family regulator n=1 Tax=Aquamicrobium terrae TaxID=1324945 RepID=A0ABV2N2A2_9HYPH